MKRSLPPIKSLAAPAAAILMVTLVVASFIWLKDYRPFGSPQQPFALGNIGLRLEGVRMAGRSNGRRTWDLQAKTVEVSQDRLTTVFNDISNGVVYDGDKPVVNLNASKATYNSFNKDLSAQGGIRMTANNKMTVGTETLRWSFLTRKLDCPSKLSFSMGSAKGSAGSLQADLANDTVLLKKVNLRFPSNEESVRLK